MLHSEHTKWAYQRNLKFTRCWGLFLKTKQVLGCQNYFHTANFTNIPVALAVLGLVLGRLGYAGLFWDGDKAAVASYAAEDATADLKVAMLW